LCHFSCCGHRPKTAARRLDHRGRRAAGCALLKEQPVPPEAETLG